MPSAPPSAPPRTSASRSAHPSTHPTVRCPLPSCQSALRTLRAFTCSDLLRLTKADAKELLGAAEGIRVYHRLPALLARLHPRIVSSDDSDSSDDEDGPPHIASLPIAIPGRSTSYSAWTARGQRTRVALCCVQRCASVVRYRCAGCGRELCAGHAVKSLWSGAQFCGRCIEQPTLSQVGRFCAIA